MTNWSNVSLGLPRGSGCGMWPVCGRVGARLSMASPEVAGGSLGRSSTRRAGPQDELSARLDDSSEATLDPAACARWCLEHEVFPGELDRAQRIEPHAEGWLVDDQGQLGLHPRPYLLQLEAHGSTCPPLPGSVDEYSEGGPWARRATIPNGGIGPSGVLAFGGKIPPMATRSYTSGPARYAFVVGCCRPRRGSCRRLEN